MKKALITLVFGLGVITVQAQDYTSAIGLRGGWYRGLTFKHFLSDKLAFEGLLMTRFRGINLTALLEIHNSIPEVDGLKWYYGGGAHVGYYNSYYYSNGLDKYDMLMGVDGILGLEYTFADYPFNISIDWKPTFNLFGGGYYFSGDSGALSIRYTFE